MRSDISYPEAFELFNRYLKTPYLRYHCRETEVIMRAIAAKLGEDETFWGICGLLHDLDIDDLGDDLSRHGERTVELLREAGYDIPVMFNAILAHVEGMEGSDHKRKTDLEFILAGAENMTGLISAYVILKPDKKIEGTKVKSIRKKFNSPAFAAKVNRDYILTAAEHAKMELNDLIGLSLEAMTTIADETGM
jgi:uncharacterized protein